MKNFVILMICVTNFKKFPSNLKCMYPFKNSTNTELEEKDSRKTAQTQR